MKVRMVGISATRILILEMSHHIEVVGACASHFQVPIHSVLQAKSALNTMQEQQFHLRIEWHWRVVALIRSSEF